MMKKLRGIAWLSLAAACVFIFAGCGQNGEEAETKIETFTFDVPIQTVTQPVTEMTEAETEPEPEEPSATQSGTTEPAAEETDDGGQAKTEQEENAAPASTAETAGTVSVYALLTAEPLNPTTTGYDELDGLVADLIRQKTTDDMNTYAKVWACYLYFVDEVTYSRGMDANTGAYSASDPESTPTQVLWATDLLNSGMGCCYNYSSALVYILRAIGLNAKLVSGYVPKYGGGTTPHCWAVVTLGGNEYVFDPDMDMNYNNRGLGKETFFGVSLESMSYFYHAETYYEE